MNELTSAIDDKKLVPHFNEVLDPYILQNQMQLNKSLGMPLLNKCHCQDGKFPYKSCRGDDRKQSKLTIN